MSRPPSRRSQPKFEKAPTVAAAGAIKKETKRKCSDFRTATEAQHVRIIQALRRRPHTSYDLRRLGCYQAPARVKELRDKFGFDITTDPVTVTDSDGFTHNRVALYTLLSEPDTLPYGLKPPSRLSRQGEAAHA